MPLALKTGCARPFFKKITYPFFFFFFFGCVYREFCHADVDSREQQAILLKKVENLSPKLRFSSFLFFRRKFGTIFILSRRSRLSRTSRAPSRLIRPRPRSITIAIVDPIRRWRISRVLTNFSENNFYRIHDLVTIYIEHPKIIPYSI